MVAMRLWRGQSRRDIQQQSNIVKHTLFNPEMRQSRIENLILCLVVMQDSGAAAFS